MLLDEIEKDAVSLALARICWVFPARGTALALRRCQWAKQPQVKPEAVPSSRCGCGGKSCLPSQRGSWCPGCAAQLTRRWSSTPGVRAAASPSSFSFAFVPQHFLFCQTARPSRRCGQSFSPQTAHRAAQQTTLFRREEAFFFYPKRKGVIHALARGSGCEASPARRRCPCADRRALQLTPGSAHPRAAVGVTVEGCFLLAPELSPPGSAEEQSVL